MSTGLADHQGTLQLNLAAGSARLNLLVSYWDPQTLHCLGRQSQLYT